MRWTEAYHMASGLFDSSTITQEAVINWADFFYTKLETCDAPQDTPQAPETPVEAPAKEEVTKTPPKRGRPAKSEAVKQSKDIDPRVEESLSHSTAVPDYQLLKTFNDARVAADMSMEDVNEYIEKTYKVDTVRKLSEVQLGDVIRHIEGMKEKSNA